MVPPGGNTTFDVVFLARQTGSVENTLYIHTSQGSFRYQVSTFTSVVALSLFEMIRSQNIEFDRYGNE